MACPTVLSEVDWPHPHAPCVQGRGRGPVSRDTRCPVPQSLGGGGGLAARFIPSPVLVPTARGSDVLEERTEEEGLGPKTLCTKMAQ